jgi:hypothetical protein
MEKVDEDIEVSLRWIRTVVHRSVEIGRLAGPTQLEGLRSEQEDRRIPTS